MANTVCIHCNGKLIKRGTLSAAFSLLEIHPKDNLRSKSSPITAYYCEDCGYITSLFVSNPENLSNQKP